MSLLLQIVEYVKNVNMMMDEKQNNQINTYKYNSGNIIENKCIHWLFLNLYTNPFNPLQSTIEYDRLAPDYVCELFTKHHAFRALRSNDMLLLDELNKRGKTYGPRAFIDVAHTKYLLIPLIEEKTH